MRSILRLVYHPRRVFWICVVFSSLSLLFNGSLLRLYGLSRQEERLIDGIAANKSKIAELTVQLQRAKDPTFIKHEARDRYDLADQGDIVFVFADQ